jgi:hypothetical protein
MTIRIPGAALAALMLLTSAAGAQGGAIDPQCRSGTLQERATQDACQKALDLFAFLAPQLGVAIAGGNAASGEHSSLRGPGHFSLGVRANVLSARFPRITQHEPVITGAEASDYDTETQVVGVPTLDAAVGIYRGFPIGGTNTMGLDLLVNVSYIPNFSTDGVDVSVTGSSFKVGIGGRLTVVEETFMTPGIAVTYLRRDLPAVDVSASPGNDEIRVNDFQVKTSAWRAVIGKNFSMLGVTVGGGQDQVETSALASVTVTSVTTVQAGPIAAVQDVTRDNLFGSLSLNLPLVSLVGEFGRTSGGRIATYNTFGGDRADDAMTYGSVALRFRW